MGGMGSFWVRWADPVTRGGPHYVGRNSGLRSLRSPARHAGRPPLHGEDPVTRGEKLGSDATRGPEIVLKKIQHQAKFSQS